MQERLQKLIAQAGIASRRAAEQLIVSGEVSVNGEIVTALGTKADPETDHIKVSGKLINAKLAQRENVYVLLNKPKGYLSSRPTGCSLPSFGGTKSVTRFLPSGSAALDR